MLLAGCVAAFTLILQTLSANKVPRKWKRAASALLAARLFQMSINPYRSFDRRTNHNLGRA